MKRLTTLVFLCAMAVISRAQDTRVNSGLSLYFTAGPNYFINNFHQFRKKVNTIDYNASLRIVWEPGYRLSLGLKTGYYKLYTVNLEGPRGTAHFDLSAIPVQLWVKTKVSKHFYAFYGMGPSICLNTMSVGGGAVVNTSFTSFADMSTGFGWQKQVNSRTSLGTEWEYFHSTKSEENVVTITILAGYRISGGRKK